MSAIGGDSPTCANAVIAVRDMRVSLSAVTPRCPLTHGPETAPTASDNEAPGVVRVPNVLGRATLATSTMRRMARDAAELELDPAVVLIDDAPPVFSFEAWLELVGENERVDLGVPAADLLAEARERGEV